MSREFKRETGEMAVMRIWQFSPQQRDFNISILEKVN